METYWTQLYELFNAIPYNDQGEKVPWTHLDPLELLPGLVHLPGVLVPLGVAAAERLLDLVKLLLDVFVLCLGVLQLGPQPVDLALALLHLLLHLLHLHLGPLIVALVKPQLSLSAPQLILGLVQLVLQFSVFNSSVYTKGTESKRFTYYINVLILIFIFESCFFSILIGLILVLKEYKKVLNKKFCDESTQFSLVCTKLCYKLVVLTINIINVK